MIEENLNEKDEIENSEEEDLVNNPTTRLPVCLCLDVSSSMSGQPIDELKKGVDFFFQAIKDDHIAKYAVEIAIVVFHSQVELRLDFSDIEKQQIPDLQASGSTSMGKGVNLSLDILEKRKKEYSEKGITYYQPWLVLMTDGCPTDDTTSALQRVEKLNSEKKINVFSVAVGNGADKDILKQFSKNDQVISVKSPEHFREFFQWLSQSTVVASQSAPGEKPKLPPVPPEIEIDL